VTAETPTTSAGGKPAVPEILARWRALAAGGHSAARFERFQKGDEFAAALIEARRDVRLRAIVMLVSATDLQSAAKRMHERAIESHVPQDSPLIGFDAVALKYTRARTWQSCAWDLDPDLPEVQPRWD
jgi:hypothetical protein